ERVAQWDQLRRPLRRLNARNPGNAEHISFLDCVRLHQLERRSRHPHRAVSRRRALGDGLVPHVHHARFPLGAQVTQRHRMAPSSPASTASKSCGFTLPCAEVRAVWTRSNALLTLPALSGSGCSRARAASSTATASSRSVKPPRADQGACFRLCSKRAARPCFTLSRKLRAASRESVRDRAPPCA